MEDRIHALEQRVAQLEAALRQLLPPEPTATHPGLQLPLPIRLVNPAGVPVIELTADGDGGLLCLNSAEGRKRVMLGTGPDGGWVDLIQAGTERLALTLFATDTGGSIERVEDGASYLVTGERYWPAEEASPEAPPAHP